MEDKTVRDKLLGEPVSGWKTSLAKFASGLGLVTSTLTVAIGAYGLIRGNPRISKEAIETSIKNAEKELGKNAGKELAKHIKPLRKMTNPGAGRLLGATNVVLGVVTGVIAKAQWDSASSAARTRNYIELHDTLNQKEMVAGRG